MQKDGIGRLLFVLAASGFVALLLVGAVALSHSGSTRYQAAHLLPSPDVLGCSFSDRDPETGVTCGWRVDQVLFGGRLLSQEEYRALYNLLEEATSVAVGANPSDGERLVVMLAPIGRYAASYAPRVFQEARVGKESFSIALPHGKWALFRGRG